MAISLTEEAANKVKEIMAAQNMSESYLRVGFRGSCSGPVYSFSLDEETDLEDELIIQDGIKIVHKKNVTELLAAVTVDFKQTEERSGFVFNNPLQVVSSCSDGGGGCCGGGGCGS